MINSFFSDGVRPPIRITACGHSFCEQCILAARPEPRDWACPICNHIHDHPVSALARNYFAEQIVQSVRDQTPRAKPRQKNGDLCNIHQQQITLCEFSFELCVHLLMI